MSGYERIGRIKVREKSGEKISSHVDGQMGDGRCFD